MYRHLGPFEQEPRKRLAGYHILTLEWRHEYETREKEIPVVVNRLQGSSIFLTSPVLLRLRISATSRMQGFALLISISGRPYRWALIMPDRNKLPFLLL